MLSSSTACFASSRLFNLEFSVCSTTIRMRTSAPLCREPAERERGLTTRISAGGPSGSSSSSLSPSGSSTWAWRLSDEPLTPMRGAGRPNDFHQLLLGSFFFFMRSVSREPLALRPASPRAMENVVLAVDGGIMPCAPPVAVASRVMPPPEYDEEPAVVSPPAVREVRGGALAVVSREGAPPDSL